MYHVVPYRFMNVNTLAHNNYLPVFLPPSVL